MTLAMGASLRWLWREGILSQFMIRDDRGPRRAAAISPPRRRANLFLLIRICAIVVDRPCRPPAAPSGAIERSP
jgi:hypothetical protein